MEFEIGKEYKSQVKVKVGPVWMKMRMDFVVDSPTTFHGRGSGAFNNYSFDNGTIEGNKLVYTTTIMGRETTSTVWISEDGTIEGEATSPGNKPQKKIRSIAVMLRIFFVLTSVYSTLENFTVSICRYLL